MFKMLTNVISVFFPRLCLFCSINLLKQEKLLCINCIHSLPILDLEDSKKNQITSIFYGKIPLENAISFLFFRKENITQKLIHHLKYRNNEKIGFFLADWFGSKIVEKKLLTNIDYIIPVPIHSKKLKKRGYNQVGLFGKTLSNKLNCIFIPNILIRKNQSKTQTTRNRWARFKNSKDQFYLTDTSYFKNKHVLLVDDVITTGATIESCCLELLKTENIKISIATIAYTEQS